MTRARTNKTLRYLYLAIAVAVSGTAVRADYLKDYWDGREAHRNRRYREAVVFLDRAIAAQPVAGERVRWTGTHFETYLPHFHLGRALYALGLYDDAARAWRESIRQGPILEKVNKRERRELEQGLDRIREERLPEEADRLRRDIESLTADLQDFRSRAIGGLTVDGEGDLALAAARIDEARTQRDFAPLARAGESVGAVRARLLAALDEVERGERARRLEAARLDYREALAGLGDGRCATGAASRLEATLDRGELPVDARVPALVLLARAREACADLLRAEWYLRRARAEQPDLDAESIAKLADLAARRRSARGASATRRTDGGAPFGLYAESHALVVGVARYADAGWPDLPEVLGDVAGVERLLVEHGFAVQTLIDPDSAQLAAALDAFFLRKRSPATRLLFYYGGHGHTEINDYLRLGYIVPADTPHPGNDSDGVYLRRLISMDGFEAFATGTLAQHAAFLFDSCFAGTIFEADGSRFRTNRRGDTTPDDALALPARLFVTAGDETQMVPADSAFRAAVVRALEGSADEDGDGRVLGAELGEYVADRGATPRNTPQWGTLEVPGFQGGDLVFRSRAERILWELVEGAVDPADLEAYLERYPAGAFAAQARRRLEQLQSRPK